MAAATEERLKFSSCGVFCDTPGGMAKDRVGELEASLEREKQERAEADERATRANERARQADEAYRKLQLELVSAKDEASAARDEGKHLQ
ncbi:MAG TPA: hypothetical protein VLT33_46205, partial [Labilithrix sp.]|nr:hypothetical protein [Labilithrix sp.]